MARKGNRQTTRARRAPRNRGANQQNQSSNSNTRTMQIRILPVEIQGGFTKHILSTNSRFVSALVGSAEVKISQISLSFSGLTAQAGTVALLTWYRASNAPTTRSQLIEMGAKFKSVSNIQNCQGPGRKEWESAMDLYEFGFISDSTLSKTETVGIVSGVITVTLRGVGNFQ